MRLLGTLDHGFGRGHLVVGTGRSSLHIDDDRVFDVDQIIEPVPELNALVSFGGPGRARVYRRDRFWQLAIRFGIFDAISENWPRWRSTDAAKDQLGWRPTGSSDRFDRRKVGQ